MFLCLQSMGKALENKGFVCQVSGGFGGAKQFFLKTPLHGGRRLPTHHTGQHTINPSQTKSSKMQTQTKTLNEAKTKTKINTKTNTKQKHNFQNKTNSYT